MCCSFGDCPGFTCSNADELKQQQERSPRQLSQAPACAMNFFCVPLYVSPSHLPERGGIQEKMG